MIYDVIFEQCWANSQLSRSGNWFWEN